MREGFTGYFHAVTKEKITIWGGGGMETQQLRVTMIAYTERA